MRHRVQIAPSILSADFAHLADHIRLVERAGAGVLHCDVMDGHFVPNLTIGPPVVTSIRKVTALPMDCHLMISDPDRFIPAFSEAGADMISVHQEACPNLDRTLNFTRSHGVSPGVVINPATPVGTLDEVLGIVDYVLVMSVNPGFGAQEFIPRTLDKVRRLALLREERGLDFRIEIDGGVTLENVAEVVRAGVDIVVVGSHVFATPDPAAAVEGLLRRAESATLTQI